jgi:hypothetical protein
MGKPESVESWDMVIIEEKKPPISSSKFTKSFQAYLDSRLTYEEMMNQSDAATKPPPPPDFTNIETEPRTSRILKQNPGLHEFQNRTPPFMNFKTQLPSPRLSQFHNRITFPQTFSISKHNYLPPDFFNFKTELPSPRLSQFHNTIIFPQTFSIS